MIVSSYNIGKGLWSKIGAIKNYIESNRIDILFLREAKIEDSAPQIKGYQFLTEMEEKKVKKIALYVRSQIRCTQVKIQESGLAPHIVLNLATMTIVGIYNEFTADSYTTDRRKQSKKEMSLKFRETVQLIESTPTISKRVLLLGDINLNWVSNEEGIRSWAEEKNYSQKVEEKTRGKSILDHVYGKNMSLPKGQVIEAFLSDHKGVVIKV